MIESERRAVDHCGAPRWRIIADGTADFPRHVLRFAAQELIEPLCARCGRWLKRLAREVLG